MIQPEDVWSVRTTEDLKEVALKVFRYQAERVQPYREFLGHLGVEPGRVKELEEIPFLPVELFKGRRIKDSEAEPQAIFRSSGTTGEDPAIHEVMDEEIYRGSYSRTFRMMYGDPSQYRILGLLPSYLERNDASLVSMVHGLMKESGQPENDFYLHDLEGLEETLQDLEERELPTILIGVSFALLDLAERTNLNLEHTIVMETGGMKGRRKEMIREELHQRLTEGLGVGTVHSEYGMTELLSQAYSKGDGMFKGPPWMKVMPRDPYDPFSYMDPERVGALNIIDLANLRSCSFLAVQDLGRTHTDGSFEVLGRMDNSDLRGCNLMAP